MTLAHLTRSGTEEAIPWIGGGIQRIVLDADATGGQLTAIRQSTPGGAASPVHVHADEDETIFLLSGAGTFWVGDQRFDLTSGDTVFLPRGLPHSYVLTSDWADVLTICNPAGFEQFVRAVGRSGTVDPEALAHVAEATGQTILGPPLAPGDVMPERYLA